MRIQNRLLQNPASIACLLLSSLPFALPAAAETSSKHGYEILHTFAGNDGATPWDTVAQDDSGNFFGTTYGGGANGLGTVYKLAPDGSFTTLYSFKGAPDGENPASLPRLAVDKRGNVYGTTTGGGDITQCGSCGTVFKITPDGVETVLYNFTGGSDGYLPYGGVTRERKTGNLFGTTNQGGQCCGAVYKLAANGALTVLTDDVFNPANGLIEDKQNNIYGTSSYYTGQVFKLAPDGTETIMYNFKGGADGADPFSALVQDASGNLYGTTYWDGANGGGTIYKIAPNGLETTLYGFTGTVNNEPYPSTLVMDRSGNLYGTTQAGGAYNQGSVFELTAAGSFVTLHSFSGGSSDGAVPYGGLTFAGKHLYGTTMVGAGTGCGGSGCGTVFRLKI